MEICAALSGEGAGVGVVGVGETFFHKAHSTVHLHQLVYVFFVHCLCNEMLPATRSDPLKKTHKQSSSSSIVGAAHLWREVETIKTSASTGP